MKIKKTNPLTNEYLEDEYGIVWDNGEEENSYIENELLEISKEEGEAFYDAANELYEMFNKAGDYVIQNNLFHELNIPFNLVQLIKKSWEDKVHWHLYSRFDLAGGLNGEPVKLIGYNADSPNMLFETAIIQWAMIKLNEIEESKQLNSLYDELIDNFKRIITLDSDTAKFEEYYKNLGWKILFSSIEGDIEGENTTRFLQHLATEAGFETDFAYVDEVGFNDEGIFKEEENFEFWFKNLPWEDIGIEENELALLLTDIVINKKAIIFNPAYTLMFQSKGMLKILWDLFPNHPLLLESSFEPLVGKKYVEKKCFGPIGANTKIVDKDGSIIYETSGDYENLKSVYQEYVPFSKDNENFYYLANVFYTNKASALGFIKGGNYLENTTKFIGHIIK